MKLSRLMLLACALVFASALAGCSSDMNANTEANANAAASPAASPSPAAQTLTEVERPQKVKDMMQQRGDEDSASPKLKIVEPKEGATLSGSTVKLKLDLSGDLKGYKPHKDPATNMGNHIHVILDNQPYEAYYDLGQPFELRNVAEGAHTIRVFPSRPWHESYKNDGAFQMVTFMVKGGGDQQSGRARQAAVAGQLQQDRHRLDARRDARRQGLRAAEHCRAGGQDEAAPDLQPTEGRVQGRRHERDHD
ncbi:MAG: hypothetical protein DMF66_06505 [Acidobacteria bacterium]|nr:MAG: hypothetical protein DMF66_06505 [Acidobacteriota bacterium]